MKTSLILFAPVLLLLAACGTTATQDAKIPRLPEDAPKAAFTYQTESLLRGVRGSYNTVPSGRAAAILRVTYTLECLKGGKPSATQHYAAAKKIIDDTFKVAPIYFDNPRERGAWNRSAKRAVIAKTGCQVTGVRDEVKTKDARQVLLFILQNKVLPPK